MPCPHNQISIVQRSNRQSAVAAAAYQSGEKLFCEYGKDVIQLEQRMAELAAADAARTKKHHERHAAAPER